jgi:sporulation protein YlmC with PRC-barrel domain
MATSPSGRHYDIALHFLDRQIVDTEGHLVAKVDDIELTQREDGRWAVTAVLIGPGALGPRMSGRFGQWIVAVWRRLHPLADPQPGRIAMSRVVEVGSAVVVSQAPDGPSIDGLELWARHHVIERLPGAQHED